MVTTLKRITTNYNFNIPVFDAPNWGAYMEKNFDIIDAALYAITGFGNVKGAWSNSTEYTAGDRVVDPVDNSIWQAAITHTSASTGSFADDRTAHATYWNRVANTAVSRGNWEAGTNYNTNEFVYDANRYGVVLEPYVSGASYNADVAAGHIQTIIDLSSQLAQTNSDKLAAAASAAAALTSEQNAATSEDNADTSEANALAYKNAAAVSASNALTSENNADDSEAAALTYKNQAGASATAAANSATASATSETHAATSETNAAASKDLAQKWASNPEDVVVSGGLYSAFHWAKKAMAAVLDTAAQITFAAAGNLVSTNVQDALEELDTEKVAKAGDKMTGELVFGVGNFLRAKSVGVDANTGYGLFWRIDANNLYLMKTAKDDPDGNWASPFPLQVRHSDGVMFNNGMELMPARIQEYPPAFTTGSVNNITNGGWYFISNLATQRPEDNFGYLLVLPLGPDGRCKQIWYGYNNNKVFSRWKNSDGTWSAWEEYTSNKTYLDATYGRLAAANTWAGTNQFNGNVNVAAAANFTHGTVKVLLETDTDIFEPTLGFTPVMQGGGTGMLTNVVKFGWSGGGKLLAQVDNSPQGALFTSQVAGGAFPSYDALNDVTFASIASGTMYTYRAARMLVDGTIRIIMVAACNTGAIDYRVTKNDVQLQRFVKSGTGTGTTIDVTTAVSQGDVIKWEALQSGGSGTITNATLQANKYTPVAIGLTI